MQCRLEFVYFRVFIATILKNESSFSSCQTKPHVVKQLTHDLQMLSKSCEWFRYNENAFDFSYQLFRNSRNRGNRTICKQIEALPPNAIEGKSQNMIGSWGRGCVDKGGDCRIFASRYAGGGRKVTRKANVFH